jgi:hypothetical protein
MLDQRSTAATQTLLECVCVEGAKVVKSGGQTIVSGNVGSKFEVSRGWYVVLTTLAFINNMRDACAERRRNFLHFDVAVPCLSQCQGEERPS